MNKLITESQEDLREGFSSTELGSLGFLMNLSPFSRMPFECHKLLHVSIKDACFHAFIALNVLVVVVNNKA